MLATAIDTSEGLLVEKDLSSLKRYPTRHWKGYRVLYNIYGSIVVRNVCVMFGQNFAIKYIKSKSGKDQKDLVTKIVRPPLSRILHPSMTNIQLNYRPMQDMHVPTSTCEFQNYAPPQGSSTHLTRPNMTNMYQNTRQHH